MSSHFEVRLWSGPPVKCKKPFGLNSEINARVPPKRGQEPLHFPAFRRGSVKVLDLGLAKLNETPLGEKDETRTARPETEQGTILGTIAYMSPEQAEGKKVDG